MTFKYRRMNHENSVLTRVAITMAPRLNNALFAPLFQQCGGISGFFEETDQNIETLFRENNLTNIQPKRSRWLQMAKQELDVMEKHHIRVCGIEDSNYPRLLKHCADAPLVLFIRGFWMPPTRRILPSWGPAKRPKWARNE